MVQRLIEEARQRVEEYVAGGCGPCLWRHWDVMVHVPSMRQQVSDVLAVHDQSRERFAQDAGLTATTRDALTLGWIEHHALSGELLDALCTPLRNAHREEPYVLGLAGVKDDAVRAQPWFGQARHPCRARYDDGLAQSIQAPRHASTLFRGVRHCIREVVAQGQPQDRELLEIRLRTLSRVSTPDRAAQVLEPLLTASPHVFQCQLLDALASVAPHRVVPHLCQHGTLPCAAQHLPRLLKRLEEASVLEAGFTEECQRVLDKLELREGWSWMVAFLDTGSRWLSHLPGKSVLQWVAEQLQPGQVIPTPQALFAQLDDRVRRTLQLPIDSFTRHVAREPSILPLLDWKESRVRGAHWPAERLAAEVRDVHQAGQTVDVPTVHAWVRRLQGKVAHGRIVHALLDGKHPAPCTHPFTILKQGPSVTWALQRLDKKVNYARFLRLADSVPCCFNSSSPWWLRNRFRIHSLWQDPLGFCFHVLRKLDAYEWDEFGFVFGGFGTCLERPVMVLNGIYLRQQHTWLRGAVLECLEATLARPLGLVSVAVANWNGGRGWLPPEYRLESRPLLRLRALLQAGGSPMRHTYDDVSNQVNITQPAFLYWKDLR